MMWSTSKGCVEKAAGLRQYSHRHCARSATCRLNWREGRLEYLAVLFKPQFAHERQNVGAVPLRQFGQGFQAHNIHLFHALPERL